MILFLTVIIHSCCLKNAGKYDSCLFCSDTVTHAYTLDLHNCAHTQLLGGLFSAVCVYVCLLMCVFVCRGGKWWLQIVLGPVDPSQSEQSCLSSSALGSRDTLIRPDSQPQEMMGRETTHSTHVTQRAGVGRQEGVWGVLDRMGNRKAVRRCVLTIAEAEIIALLGTTQTAHTHTHKCTDRQIAHTCTQIDTLADMHKVTLGACHNCYDISSGWMAAKLISACLAQDL